VFVQLRVAKSSSKSIPKGGGGKALKLDKDSHFVKENDLVTSIKTWDINSGSLS